MLALTPAIGEYNAFELSGFVVFFLGPIITGYIFAKQIREENRTKTILKIAVLVAFIAMFMILIDDDAVEWAPYYRAECLKKQPHSHTNSIRMVQHPTSSTRHGRLRHRRHHARLHLHRTLHRLNTKEKHKNLTTTTRTQEQRRKEIIKNAKQQNNLASSLHEEKASTICRLCRETYR